jgi:hypothetical protein
MKVLLAGLWSRRGLNAAILLVAVTALGASLLGPMYGRASAEHLLDSRVAQRAPYVTGLSYAVPALDSADLPVGSPDRYQPPAPSDLVGRAHAPLDLPDWSPYWSRATPWVRDAGGHARFGSTTFEVPLYWRQGMCRLATVTGRCPQQAGEVLVQQTMARTLDLEPGDRLSLQFTESWLGPEGEFGGGRPQRDALARRDFTVVGTYQVPTPDSPAWYDLSRFRGIADLVPPPAKGAGAPPATPALLTAPASMTSQTFVAGVDRPLDPEAVDVADLDRVQALASRFSARTAGTSTAIRAEDLDVATLFDEVRAERSLLAEVTFAALAPLVVLALLLLFAMVASATAVRRPHIALAKLRGHSRRQVLGFALGEPFVLIVLAVPVSLALAWAAAAVIARTWLTAGIPVRPDAVALGSLGAVALAALGAAAVAAIGVIREPLATALAAGTRPRSASRWGLVLRSAVVAVAVASVASVLTSDREDGRLLGLLAPLFIALAVAVLGVWLLARASTLWLRRTAGRGGTPAYLASRRLARRDDLVRLMVPLLLAVSVITFSASAAASADDWRVSRAKAQVGAAQVFTAAASPGRLLQVTRRVDPEGRYVAAAVVGAGGEGTSRTLYVDTGRLARVAAWDEDWSDLPVTELQRRLDPGGGEPLQLTGQRVELTVTDVRLRSTAEDDPVLWLQYTDDRGEQADVALGAVPNGPRVTLAAPVPGCVRGCTVEQLYLAGSASSVTDEQGTLTLARVRVDGAPVDWRLDEADAWRAARPFPVSMMDPPVVLEPGSAGLRVRVYLGHLPPGAGLQRAPVSGFARITPGATPAVLPALVARDTERTPVPAASSAVGLEVPAGQTVVSGAGVNTLPAPLRVVGTVEALPGLGAEGVLADLGASLVEYEPTPGQLVSVQLWAAPDTPPRVLDAVRDAGVRLSGPRRLDAVLDGLRGDAFSLGWRIFLVVGGLTLLLAVFGVLASAVAQSRWRAYEVAALRVVGLSRASLVRASVLEHGVMLGCAVLLGLVASYTSLRLVLPQVELGGADPLAPEPTYAVHGWILLTGGAGVFALALLIALGVSRRVVRLGRPGTLRSAEQA